MMGFHDCQSENTGFHDVQSDDTGFHAVCFESCDSSIPLVCDILTVFGAQLMTDADRLPGDPIHGLLFAVLYGTSTDAFSVSIARITDVCIL